MNCFYHKDRSAVAYCAVCRKGLCSDCIITEGGQFYCRDCFKDPARSLGIKKMVFPALVCGSLVGFLFYALNVVNCTVCLTPILGGALAVLLFKVMYSIPGTIKTKRAVQIGAMTGFCSSAVMWLTYVAGTGVNSVMEEIGSSSQTFADAGISSEAAFGIVLLFAIVVIGIVFSILAAVGGVLCNTILGLRK